MKQTIKKLFFKDADMDYLFGRGILKGLRFSINPMNKLQRMAGLDEREIEKVIRQFAARAKSAIDVGANAGWYTLFLAAQANIEKIIACEPESQYTDVFDHNFSINPHVHKSKVKHVKAFAGSGGGPEFIRMDELAEGLPEPILMKIDVDGGELDVLQSAESTLINKKVLLVVETHSYKLEKDCIAYLTSLGYQVTIVKNAWYRVLIPDLRPLEMNRWFYASK